MTKDKAENMGCFGCLWGLIKGFFFMFSVLAALIATQEIFKHLIYLNTVVPKLEAQYMQVENIILRSGGSRRRGMTQHYARGHLVNTKFSIATVEISLRSNVFSSKVIVDSSINYDTILPLKNLYDEIIPNKDNEEIVLTQAILELNKILPIWYSKEEIPGVAYANALLRLEGDGESYSASRKIKPLILYTIFLLPAIFLFGIRKYKTSKL